MAGNHRVGDSPAFDLADTVELGETSDSDSRAAAMTRALSERGPLVGFGTMVRFQGALLGLALLLGYLLGFLSPQIDSTPEGLPSPGDYADGSLRSLNWLGYGWPWSVTMGVGVAIGLVLLVRWMERQQWAWLVEIEGVVEQVLVPSLRACSVWQLAGLAALAGIGEELLFRWAIQGGLELGLRWMGVADAFSSVRGLSGPDVVFLLAALVSAVLFGLCHAVTRAYGYLASALGLLFSLIVVGGGGLVAAILAHGLYDFLVFLMLCQSDPVARS